MNEASLLALHREMVAIPSTSTQEQALCDYLEDWLRGQGVEVRRWHDNLYATCGEGPLLCFNSHFDTVPPSPGWTRPPYQVEVINGRVYGLGSNDAKAAAAAMIAAFLRLRARGKSTRVRLLLTLVSQEETGGMGTEVLIPELYRQGLMPQAVIVGEPTGLEVAIAQKGLLILELRCAGQACHAAHRRALGAPNALRLLAQDLAALDTVDLGPPHPWLGPVTVEPTMASGGTAYNIIPAEAQCVIDVRTNPSPNQSDTVSRLRAAVQGELRILNDRLVPYEIDPGHLLVRAAKRARLGTKLFGSRGLSDLVLFEGIPAIKVGPGETIRSHTPDEFVLESEILAGANFYEEVALAYGRLMAGEA